jgi:hypothetical protein
MSIAIPCRTCTAWCWAAVKWTWFGQGADATLVAAVSAGVVADVTTGHTGGQVLLPVKLARARQPVDQRQPRADWSTVTGERTGAAGSRANGR